MSIGLAAFTSQQYDFGQKREKKAVSFEKR
jgi:hypothetical protein